MLPCIKVQLNLRHHSEWKMLPLSTDLGLERWNQGAQPDRVHSHGNQWKPELSPTAVLQRLVGPLLCLDSYSPFRVWMTLPRGDSPPSRAAPCSCLVLRCLVLAYGRLRVGRGLHSHRSVFGSITEFVLVWNLPFGHCLLALDAVPWQSASAPPKVQGCILTPVPLHIASDFPEAQRRHPRAIAPC